MTRLRQHKLKPMLRVGAALLVLVWIAASGLCSVEHLFSHAESGTEHHADAAEHQHDAVASSTTADHSHDSDKHDDSEHSCCSSLNATPQSGGFGNVPKPDLGKPVAFNFLWLTEALTFVQPEARFLRQPPNREWVFTPEVFLGPAFRSHAPPLAI